MATDKVTDATDRVMFSLHGAGIARVDVEALVAEALASAPDAVAVYAFCERGLPLAVLPMSRADCVSAQERDIRPEMRARVLSDPRTSERAPLSDAVASTIATNNTL